MIKIKDVQKGDLILNKLGQTCRVTGVGHDPGGSRQPLIYVDYGDGVECSGYESAFFWHTGKPPNRVATHDNRD